MEEMGALRGGQPAKWCRCAAAIVALWATGEVHAASGGFATMLGGSGQDYAAAVASDAAGNTYVAGLTYSPDFPAPTGSFQPKLGGNGSLANPTAIASDAFVAKIGPTGTVLWATFLGGSGADYATGVGVDQAGNVVVTGWTRSIDFPVTQQAVQRASAGGWDAFVTKLDPTGSKAIYSTYLGGPNDDGAYGLALDAGGNAYVTGSAGSAVGFTGLSTSATGSGLFVSKVNPQGGLVYSFFQPNVSFAPLGGAAAIAVDSLGSAYIAGTVSSYNPITPTSVFGVQGAFQALVMKLSPEGSKVIYATTLGGSANAYGMAVAVDPTGAAYVAGLTSSVDFPLLHPLQSTLGARPLWKSTDAGSSWTPRDNLPFAFLQALAIDPTNPQTLYAANGDVGIFKSVDGGVTWSSANHGLTTTQLENLAIDPLHPRTLFTAAGSTTMAGMAVFRTTDGGNNWTMVDSNAKTGTVKVAIDAQNSNNVYWNGGGVTRKSTDGGTTWSNLPFPGTSIAALALDPRVSGSIYVYSTPIVVIKPPPTGTPSYIWHSTDGGVIWTQITNPTPGIPQVWTIDGSTSPSTVYNGLNSRSTDNGATWTTLPISPVSGGNTTAIAVDASGTLYAAVYNQGLFTSHDHGQTWASIGTPVPVSTLPGSGVNVLGIVPVGTGGTLYAVLQNQQTSGFVTKLSPDGSNMVFSTLLNGHQSLAPVQTVGSEPGVFLTQSWISAIALDPSNNVVVAGGTRAVDFPVANPKQAANAGEADAFVATLAADGGKLNYSTYFGGSRDDSALAVTLDAQGNVIFVGQTWSSDFPLVAGTPLPYSYGNGFVVKLTPAAPPAITSVTNGASYQPGIEAGSWVMIQGSTLANTNPGRTWTSADFVGGNLPTALDGVRVTIDGKPAFVEYISPTQINVQAPADSVTGTVNVVVDNNGALSAPGTAQLQAVAPAFFMDPTSNVYASHLPGYAPVGNPAAPAHPGDLLALWGTGFGATNPPVAPGTTVTGAPAATVAPTVTVGGMAVPVLSTVLTTGSAALYQVTIQLPASVPTGTVAIQASSGTVQSPAGVTIFVEKP